jgi:hypothetical protein
LDVASAYRPFVDECFKVPRDLVESLLGLPKPSCGFLCHLRQASLLSRTSLCHCRRLFSEWSSATCAASACALSTTALLISLSWFISARSDEPRVGIRREVLLRRMAEPRRGLCGWNTTQVPERRSTVVENDQRQPEFPLDQPVNS